MPFGGIIHGSSPCGAATFEAASYSLIEMELSTKLSQQQLLSPQMQQSLQLLQAPMMELRQLVSQELTSNPMLEEEGFSPQETSLHEPSREEAERHHYFLESQHSVETLANALTAQTAGFPKKELPIVECIIGNLDTAGYLTVSAQEIAALLGMSEQVVEDVITKIQQLDPPGVAAQNLEECLLLQLERRGKGNSLASRIVRHYLPELGSHNYEKIALALRVSLHEVFQAHKVIKSLEPHPGRSYGPVEAQEVIPDVIVIAEGKELIVHPNKEALPRLRLNDHYKEILSTEVENEELSHYLRGKIRQGRHFLTYLDQRQKTLLAVSREIIKHQYSFFETGNLNPLTMAEIASTLELHPTTISRAVAGKYMETPRGLFPWKYFFTAGLQKEDGTSISNNAIKQALQQLIHQENKRSPLSDQEIAEQLQAQGISIARRTVAHYREQLKILPKKLRRETTLEHF